LTSASLDRWRGERSQRLDEIIDAHTALGGTGVGRRWVTAELNRALVGRLAAQFQGFAKDLHAEAAVTFGSLAQPNDPKIARVISAGLQKNRELDRANAQEDSLSSDFARFGLDLWDEMAKVHRRTGSRRTHLKRFNTARNALAHDDAVKLAQVVAQGYRLDLACIRRWRSALDGLATTMDIVMAMYLARLFSVPRPW
jgi:hypothetical protein